MADMMVSAAGRVPVDTLHHLSDAQLEEIKAQAYQDGWDDGNNEGYNQGYDDATGAE